VAEVIMIPKPGKPPHDATSYRPISLLPVLSKLFEKLLLKRLKLIIEEKKLIPDHQFGFRNQHSTVDQVHRNTTIIEQSLEEKKVCSTIFLDVNQAFEKSLA
jgi:predicted metallopeptidase